MIGLLGTFIVFIAAGYVIMRNLRMHKREVWAFTIITGMGFVLWASILADHPLDLNKAIAWVIETMD